MNGICNKSGATLKEQIYELWVQKEKRYKTKGTDNLFNKIIAEKFPNLEKERDRRSTEHQTIRARKETPPNIS
jgi:hypothetical protein